MWDGHEEKGRHFPVNPVPLLHRQGAELIRLIHHRDTETAHARARPEEAVPVHLLGHGKVQISLNLSIFKSLFKEFLGYTHCELINIFQFESL